MLTVKFFSINSGKGEHVGTVTFDGQHLRADTKEVEDVIETPIHVRRNREGKREKVKPSEDPVAFMKDLCTVYRSPYFYAGEVRES
jgi:hypothetical protein